MVRLQLQSLNCPLAITVTQINTITSKWLLAVAVRPRGQIWWPSVQILADCEQRFQPSPAAVQHWCWMGWDVFAYQNGPGAKDHEKSSILRLWQCKQCKALCSLLIFDEAFPLWLMIIQDPLWHPLTLTKKTMASQLFSDLGHWFPNPETVLRCNKNTIGSICWCPLICRCASAVKIAVYQLCKNLKGSKIRIDTYIDLFLHHCCSYKITDAPFCVAWLVGCSATCFCKRSQFQLSSSIMIHVNHDQPRSTIIIQPPIIMKHHPYHEQPLQTCINYPKPLMIA